MILVETATLEAAYPVCNLESFKRWIEVLKPYQTAPPGVMRPVLKAHAADLIAKMSPTPRSWYRRRCFRRSGPQRC